MKKSRVVERDELGMDSLGILREFEEWFLPATIEEAGHEFLMFLGWLDEKGYKIIEPTE